MIALRRSHAEERDALYDLWAKVFEEDLVWLDRFFATRYAPSHIYLATVEGKIASALHGLPATYVQAGVENPCLYIVGAATEPSCRRQGLMGQLLSFVKAESNTPVTLFPAVRPYYESHGYTTSSSLYRFDLPKSGREADSIPLPSWQVFDALYRSEHSEAGYLVRDAIAWEFLITGYESVAVEGGYAFIKDGIAIEAVASDGRSAEELIALLASMRVASIQVLKNSPLAQYFAPKEGVPIPMGMSTDLSLSGVYISEQY